MTERVMAGKHYNLLRDRMRSDLDSVGQKVRTVREEKGVSQADIARTLGIDAAQVSRLERGVIGDPCLSTLWGIADTLKVSLDDLLGRTVPNG
tara:strand:+ start:199 stop:477 length:279 start_codon:yes stop_codon:yes gene_type:complete